MLDKCMLAALFPADHLSQNTVQHLHIGARQR